jgi:hypothetical protein
MRLGWNGLTVTNTLAYFDMEITTEKVVWHRPHDYKTLFEKKISLKKNILLNYFLKALPLFD